MNVLISNDALNEEYIIPADRKTGVPGSDP